MSLAEQHLRPPEYEQIREILLENAKMTDVKRAAAFFKLIRYSYGSGCTSFGCQPFDVRKYFDVIWKASNRLAETVIENKDKELYCVLIMTKLAFKHGNELKNILKSEDTQMYSRYFHIKKIGMKM